MIALLLFAACTASSHATVDRTDCITCHAADFEATPGSVKAGLGSATCMMTDHLAAAYPTTCADCHGTVSWCPADAKHTMFDLTNPSHAGWDCKDCHTSITYDPPLAKVVDTGLTGLDCTSCHWHDQARVDPFHVGKGGYAYGPATCMASECHGGRAKQ